jgi:predicted transcriptional regulator
MVVEDPSATSVDSTLEDHASSLRAYLDQQLSHRHRLEQELELVKERVHRAERAVSALSDPINKPGRKPGTQQQPAPPPGKKPRRGKRGQTSTNTWVPSEKSIARTLAALEEQDAGDGVSISTLSKSTGMATETVRRSLDVLREREQARHAGKKRVGQSHVKANVFKKMPEHSEVDGTHELHAELAEAMSNA